MYGHIQTLAEAEKSGIEAAGGKADLYQVRETLPTEVLSKMHAPGQSSEIPFITPEIMEGYDAFLLGIPTRYGNFPAQWKSFFDHVSFIAELNGDNDSGNNDRPDGKAVADRRFLGEVRWCIRFHGDVRWGPGEYGDCCDEHVRASWDYLCAAGIQDDVPDHGESQ